VTKHPIDFHSRKIQVIGVAYINCLDADILPNIFFVFNRSKKLTGLK